MGATSSHGPRWLFFTIFGLAVSMSVCLSTFCDTKLKLVSELTELFSVIQQDVEGDLCPLGIPKKGPLVLAKLQWDDLETNELKSSCLCNFTVEFGLILPRQAEGSWGIHEVFSDLPGLTTAFEGSIRP